MAISTKDRSRAYRQRRNSGGMQAIQFTLSKITISTIDDYIGISGNSRAEVVENAIASWACDAAEALPKLREMEERRKAEQLKSTQGNSK
ncbi:hypothetical protein ABXJ76_06795 [Methylobacter sp. G7]|uniref:hypothetical protein n=1 Tax=Methylobacter sp. G7 TaxID=3230117 RepID=UPI003D801B9B